MIQREIAPLALRWSSQYPVLTITGPRQSGKTTLAKHLFPKKDYVSLEDLEERNFAQTDPKGFLNHYKQGAIIDEIQRCPDLLSYLQVEVDAVPSSGRFILTGSGQFEMMQSVSQSLAGRTAILRLLPFSFEEGYKKIASEDLLQVMFKGFYPRIFDKDLNPTEMLSFYTTTYLEKDVRTLLNIKDLHRFEIFLKLCAGRSGQELNLNEISSSCGSTLNTVKSWISVLEASFIIKIIPPYFNNFNKRLIKAPKLFFLDSGLLCYLLGLRTSDQLFSHPLKGAIFETFIFSEILKAYYNKGMTENIYFLRDSKGHEVDLVLDKNGILTFCEIKSSETIASDFFRNLSYFRTLSPNAQGVCVYGGKKERIQDDTTILPWFHVKKLLG